MDHQILRQQFQLIHVHLQDRCCLVVCLFHDVPYFVIDLTGRWDVSTDAIPSNPLVTNIRLGRFKNRTRVVIDMTSQPRNAKVNLSKNRCRLDVRVDR